MITCVCFYFFSNLYIVNVTADWAAPTPKIKNPNINSTAKVGFNDAITSVPLFRKSIGIIKKKSIITILMPIDKKIIPSIRFAFQFSKLRPH